VEPNLQGGGADHRGPDGRYG
jgi:hypothetical protein